MDVVSPTSSHHNHSKKQFRGKVVIQVTSKRRQSTAGNLFVTIGILEKAVTGRLASTPMPTSTVEELAELRTATSHRKEANNNSAGGLSLNLINSCTNLNLIVTL